jgi:hypothetical protein
MLLYGGFSLGYRIGYRAGRQDKQADVDWAQRVASGRTDWDQWGNPPAYVSTADMTHGGSVFLSAADEAATDAIER